MDCKHYGNISGMDPYAPGKDFAYIPQQREEVTPLDPESALVVNSTLRLRIETFGTALIVDGNFKSIVTSDTAELLEQLRGTTFTLGSISAEYGLEVDMLRKFFASLHALRVVCFAG